jgi:hypothetical protein
MPWATSAATKSGWIIGLIRENFNEAQRQMMLEKNAATGPRDVGVQG